MEAVELTRAVVGVPIAAAVPRFIPGIEGRWRRMPVVLVLGLWSLAPVLGEWRSWLVLAFALLASQTLGDGEEGGGWLLARAAGVALFMAALTGGVLDWSSSADALESAHAEADAVVVVSFGLVNVFAGGAAIERLLAPFAANVRPGASGDLARAGLLIGWLERALLYGFVVAGAAGGAALVVAAKSLARLPSLSEKDKFAEYFLIGTLASVLVAVGLGATVRAILGLGPLLT